MHNDTENHTFYSFTDFKINPLQINSLWLKFGICPSSNSVV